jgi:hypothetical protein
MPETSAGEACTGQYWSLVAISGVGGGTGRLCRAFGSSTTTPSAHWDPIERGSEMVPMHSDLTSCFRPDFALRSSHLSDR